MTRPRELSKHSELRETQVTSVARMPGALQGRLEAKKKKDGILAFQIIPYVYHQLE